MRGVRDLTHRPPGQQHHAAVFPAQWVHADHRLQRRQRATVVPSVEHQPGLKRPSPFYGRVESDRWRTRRRKSPSRRGQHQRWPAGGRNSTKRWQPPPAAGGDVGVVDAVPTKPFCACLPTLPSRDVAVFGVLVVRLRQRGGDRHARLDLVGRHVCGAVVAHVLAVAGGADRRARLDRLHAARHVALLPRHFSCSQGT